MRTVMTRFAMASIIAFVAACGSDVTGPTYNDISGSYAGQMAGLSQGIALSATFRLTITQQAGTLSGSWALQGTLTDGVSSVPVQGTGTLTGTIATGNNPSVNITVRTGFCPHYSAQFSGAYDTPNRRLTITGPVDILSDACAILLRYQGTIILNR